MRPQGPCAQLMCTVLPSAIFLPKDPKNPVLMAGTGMGVGPWRAVVQERVMQRWQGRDIGLGVLFFGALFSKCSAARSSRATSARESRRSTQRSRVARRARSKCSTRSSRRARRWRSTSSR